MSFPAPPLRAQARRLPQRCGKCMPQPPVSASSGNGFSIGDHVQSLDLSSGATHFDPIPQGISQKGYQSILWTADDANDDQLEFAVYFRGENETTRKLLEDVKLDTRFYSWDTTSMPDGAAIWKIVTSDSPSNPDGQGLTSERQSERFLVDNTCPASLSSRLRPPVQACGCDFQPAPR